jgi:hypothetical protein
MRLEHTQEEKRVHRRFIIDDIPHYRNEDFCLKDGIWVSITEPKLLWAVGGKKGDGPFVCPKNWLELERQFKLMQLCSEKTP